MRQHVMDIFHHHVDVQIQHPVDGVRVGIDQVAADIGTGVGVQDVELARFFQNPRQQRRAAFWIEQVELERDRRIAELFTDGRERSLIAVNQHHPRPSRQHRLGAGPSDARRRPGDGSDFTL